MTAILIVNFIASALVFFGVVFAVFSKHVCDGILIKKGLVALAFGAAANAMHPDTHTQVWIICSLAAIVVFVGIRLVVAKIMHKKPIFLVF